MSELSVRETAARALGERFDVPIEWADVDAVLAAVADHDGLADALAQVLLDHQPRGHSPWGDGVVERHAVCWCGDVTPKEFFGWRLREHHRKHVAAHLADVVRAWLRGDT